MAAHQEPVVPDGLDPSFLAALPENIRQEVIADHLRLQRIQQRTREQQSPVTPGGMEVNPEFLAALPPNIQEEVLAQQRLEQERLSAQTKAQANPEAPVDPTSFFATLPSNLRQSVLADMDDSMVAVLPADLAAEAQSLRRDLEERHRRMMQERLFTSAGSGSLSSILRHAGTFRYIGQAPRSGQLCTFAGRLGSKTPDFGSSMKLRGRYLLDHETLTCLLVLLFVDEPKLNTGRLHCVMRYLCYHGPTRSWVIRAMLFILNRTGDCRIDEDKTKTPEKGKTKKSQSQPMQIESQNSPNLSRLETCNQGSWLSISLEAALGCRANVFQVSRQGGKKHSSVGSSQVTIHPQAALIVCRHVLDALISLAKMFPQQFLPSKAKKVQNCDSEKVKDKKTAAAGSVPVSSSGSTSPRSKNMERQDSKPDSRDTEFWELLLKLDAMCSSKKGKGIQKPHSHVTNENEAAFRDYNSSPLGQLMTMLSHPVIKRSQLLTDRLLRLLGLVSTGLSDSQQQTSTNIRINNPPRGIVILNNDASASRGAAAATVRPATTNTGTNTQVVVPPEGTSVDPPQTTEQAKTDEEQKEETKKAPDEIILEPQLATAVEVLTSKSCSEEGLEEATNLLLQLSWANNITREAILQLLLQGGRELGLTVCQNIRSLLEELKSLNFVIPEVETEDGKEMETASTSHSIRGVLTDRFSGANVVVTAPKKTKGGRELQLASMSALTSKASSQHFFLRILKVIIQLRDAARSANKPGGKKKPAERVRITKSQADMEVKEKEELILTCEVNKLDEKPVWYLDDNEITPSDRVKPSSRGILHKLTIQPVKPHDEGKYTVAFGDVKSSAEVTIQEQPVEFVSPLKDIAKPEKSAVLLECEVSKLNAQVEWSRNKQPITVQDGYDIKSDNTYHTLHLDNVGPDDTAEFTVAVDEKTSTSKLTVKGCDVTLTSNHGMLFSPGYVGRINYPNNVMCTWTINANEPITIYFESDLQLVDDHKCIQDSNDFLQIYRGLDARGSALHSGRGLRTAELAGQTFQSNSNGQIHVSFKTSPTANERGFMVKWSKDCVNPMYDSYTLIDNGNTPVAPYHYRASMTLTCALGYGFNQQQFAPLSSPTQSVTFTCGYKGEWNYRYIPRCTANYCGDVPRISNGYIAFSTGSVYGGLAGYECYPGSEPISQVGPPGNKNITCQPNSLWQTPPTCQKGAVTITKPLSGVQITEGQDVDFECTVSKPDLTAEWTKDGAVLTPTDRVKPKSVNTTHILHIASVEIDDAAEYVVKVGDATSKSTLSVEEKPIEFIRKLSDVDVGEIPGTATLECEISEEGVPVKWYRDNTELAPSNKYMMIDEGTIYKLVISDVDGEDEGKYAVIAKGQKSEASVFVEGPPELFLDKQFEEVITFKRGQSTAFEIPFKGWPQPSVKWTYNEGELPDKKRMEVETIYNMTTVRLAKVIGSAFAPSKSSY